MKTKVHLIESPSSRTKNFVATIIWLLMTLTVLAQAPTIQWQKSLGGISSDIAHSIQQTTDGGYIVAGLAWSSDGDVTGNHGINDYWIVKLDSVGTIQWQKCLGGSGVGGDEAHSIQQTTDGGYIVAGQSSSNDGDVTGNHGSLDYWIVKLDSIGTIQWQKSLGGTRNDYAYSIQQTTDGGYIVAGDAESNDGDVTGHHGTTIGSNDYWIVKLDSVGTIQWQKSLGGTSSDDARSIQQTTDGGYIVAGLSYSTDGDVTGKHGAWDYWIVKLDSVGTIQWQKCLGGTSDEQAHSIQQTTDGGYIVAGRTHSNDGDVSGKHSGINADYWVVKLDSVGIIQWKRCLGGTNGNAAFSIQQTTDGGYVVAGYSASNDDDVTGNHGGLDYWIVKLDSIGTIQWQKSLGGTGSEQARSIQQTTDGGYIIAGYSGSNDGDVSGNHGSVDYWIVKLGCLTSTSSQVVSNTTTASIVLSVDTIVTTQVDTIANDVITTTDSIFITKHSDTTTIITDSTVVITNQCDSSVISSVVYSDTVSTSVTISDTIIHQSSDTASLIVTGMTQIQMRQITLSPNPVKAGDYVWITRDPPVPIEILNLMGQIMYKGQTSNFKVPELWSTGMYIVRIMHNNEVITKKLQIY